MRKEGMLVIVIMVMITLHSLVRMAMGIRLVHNAAQGVRNKNEFALMGSNRIRGGRTLLVYDEKRNCLGMWFIIQVWKCGTTTTTARPLDFNRKKLERIIISKLPDLLEQVASSLKPKLKPIAAKLAPRIAPEIAKFINEKVYDLIPEPLIETLEDVQIPELPPGGNEQAGGVASGKESLTKFLEDVVPKVFSGIASVALPGVGSLIVAGVEKALDAALPNVKSDLAKQIAEHIEGFVPSDVLKTLQELGYQ